MHLGITKNKIFSDIKKYSSITGEPNLLEIGTGTGIATLPFAAMGCGQTCLDIGNLLLTEAKKNLREYPNVEFINQSFEDCDLPGNKFQLIFSVFIEPDLDN